MAKKKKDKKALIILVLLLLYLLFGQGGFEVPVDQPGKSQAIKPVFYDINRNRVVPVSEIFKKQSYVDFPGGNPYAGMNLYYFYFTVTATLVGTTNTPVRVRDIRIKNYSNQFIPDDQMDQIRLAWGCMFDQQQTLIPGTLDEYTWDPHECAGDGALADLTRFEDPDAGSSDPSTFTFLIEGEFTDVFGFTHNVQKEAEFVMSVTSAPGAAGGFDVGITFVGEATLEQCDYLIPETTECLGAGIPDSSCEGLVQTCTQSGSFGLWPGCHFSDYVAQGDSFVPERPYTGTSELAISHQSGKTWQELCSDGFDNDCDNLFDADGAGGKGGGADPDCPSKEVTFRTNADIPGLGDTVEAYWDSNVWIAVDHDKDGDMQPFAYTSISNVNDVSGDCSDECPDGANFLGLTPLGANRVCKFGTGRYVGVYVVKNSNTCYKINFDSRQPAEGCPSSPGCLSIAPEAPWSLTNRETQYQYW